MGHYVDILLEFVTRFAEVGAAIVILTGITQTLYRWARHWRWGRISPTTASASAGQSSSGSISWWPRMS